MFLAKAKLALHCQLNSFVELKSVADLCDVCESLDVLRMYSILAYKTARRFPNGNLVLDKLNRSTGTFDQSGRTFTGNRIAYRDATTIATSEVVPTTSRPSDSSRVLPDDQLFDDFNAQPQRASRGSSCQTQPSRSGSHVIEVEVSPSFTEQEEHNPEGVPQSPFRPRRSTRPCSQWNEPPLTYNSLGGHALLLKQVRSCLFDYVVSSTSPDVVELLVK
eukprot:scaffold3929_cov102-Amphora_coffeaeformis.AAC.1